MTNSTQGSSPPGAGRDNRFEIRSPMGEPIAIPIDPDPAVGGLAPSAQDGRAHFEEHGYVILPGFIAPERCEEIIRTYESTLKPWTGSLPRYPTSASEPSVYDDRGRIENGFMGAHRWSDPELGLFTQTIGDLVAPSGDVARAASVFMGGPVVLIETFYFEINGNTTPHRDIDFLPSAETIVVMWMALEDIAAGAGRLYLYPGTHHGHAPIGAHSCVTDDYSATSLNAAREHGTPCTAPAVRRGDVVAFNGALVHGSLETRDGSLTRHSLTAHFGPTHATIVRS